VGLLTPLAVPQQPWTTVSTDFLSMRPIKVFLTDILPGYRPEKEESLHEVTFHKLMVIQDTLTDYTFLIPCTSYITAKDVIEMWKQNVAPTVGLPHALISDQDPLFMSREFQEWLRTNGIEHKASSPYHPQTDGQTERKNKTIIPMFIAEQAQGINWVKAAPKVQTQVNARISEPRKNSSFFLMYGFNPKLAASPLPHPIPIYANPTKLHYQLGKNLTKAKLNQITSANKHRRPATPYEEGELVMVSTKNFPSHFNTNKLHYP